jgi:hypothetical protein
MFAVRRDAPSSANNRCGTTRSSPVETSAPIVALIEAPDATVR